MDEEGAHARDELARVGVVAAEGRDDAVQRAVHRLRAERGQAAGPRVVGEEAEELAHLLGVHLPDHEAARVHAPRLGEQRRDVGLAVHAETHAERALLERRQVGAALHGDEPLVHGDELEQRVEERRLAGGAVAEDDQGAAVAQELGQLGALPAAQRAALEQPAERRGDHAGSPHVTGVHDRGVREEGGAARDEVLEVRGHLRLEQAPQDLEVLARALAHARALELADRGVDLLDERDLDGAQRLVAALGRDAFPGVVALRVVDRAGAGGGQVSPGLGCGRASLEGRRCGDVGLDCRHGRGRREGQAAPACRPYRQLGRRG